MMSVDESPPPAPPRTGRDYPLMALAVAGTVAAFVVVWGLLPDSMVGRTQWEMLAAHGAQQRRVLGWALLLALAATGWSWRMAVLNSPSEVRFTRCCTLATLGISATAFVLTFHWRWVFGLD